MFPIAISNKALPNLENIILVEYKLPPLRRKKNILVSKKIQAKLKITTIKHSRQCSVSVNERTKDMKQIGIMLRIMWTNAEVFNKNRK